MKKLIILIVLAFTTLGYSQAEFEKIAITENTATAETSRIVSQQPVGGELNYIDATALPISTATQTALDLKSNKESGLLLGGGLSVNADPTKWDLAFGEGYVSNSLTGVVEKISWGTQTALTTPYRTTSVATYVLMANAGGGFGTITLQNTAPTQQQYRTHIYLGKLAHTTFGNILFAVTEPSRMFDVAGQVSDLNKFLGSGNVEGNIATYNGANLNINCSAGMTYRAGANYLTDRNSPSITTEPIFTAGTFRNKFRNGSGGWTAVNTTTVDNGHWDNGSGILQVVPNNKWTVMVFWRFGGTGTIHCDYGQVVYDNKVDALAAAGKAAVSEDPENKRDASKRAWLIVKQGVNVLNDIATAEFIPADKLGERASGSSSIATFQSTYLNSTTPQISITDALGSLILKSSRSSNASNIQEWANIAGTTIASVNGDGTFSVSGITNSNSFVKTGGTSSQFLKADGSVDSTSYLPLTGGTVSGTTNFTDGTSIVRVINSSGTGFMGTSTNHPLALQVNADAKMTLETTGVVKINNLSGTGTRNVVADASGNLSTDSTVYAPLASPALTGTPTAPTATAGTTGDRVATLDFVYQNARPYKVYTALLSQSGTSAPTATVLENTSGATPTLSRTGAGAYTVTSTGMFTSGKTFIITPSITLSSYIISTRLDSDTITIDTRNASGVLTDGLMTNSSFEIRIYP